MKTLLILTALSLAACTTNPQSGRYELTPAGEAALIRIGEAAITTALSRSADTPVTAAK